MAICADDQFCKCQPPNEGETVGQCIPDPDGCGVDAHCASKCEQGKVCACVGGACVPFATTCTFDNDCADACTFDQACGCVQGQCTAVAPKCEATADCDGLCDGACLCVAGACVAQCSSDLTCVAACPPGGDCPCLEGGYCSLGTAGPQSGLVELVSEDFGGEMPSWPTSEPTPSLNNAKLCAAGETWMTIVSGQDVLETTLTASVQLTAPSGGSQVRWLVVGQGLNWLAGLRESAEGPRLEFFDLPSQTILGTPVAVTLTANETYSLNLTLAPSTDTATLLLLDSAEQPVGTAMLSVEFGEIGTVGMNFGVDTDGITTCLDNVLIAEQ